MYYGRCVNCKRSHNPNNDWRPIVCSDFAGFYWDSHVVPSWDSGALRISVRVRKFISVWLLSLILDYRLGLWKRLTSQLLVLFFINTVSIYTCAATHITTSGFTQVGGSFLLCCTYVCTLNYKYLSGGFFLVFVLVRAHNLSVFYFVCLRFAFCV